MPASATNRCQVHTVSRAVSRTASSILRRDLKNGAVQGGWAPHARIKGVNREMAMAVFPHQFRQATQKEWLRPAVVSTAAPRVAPRIGPNNAAPTSRPPYSRRVASCGLGVTHRRTSQAPVRAPLLSATNSPSEAVGGVPLSQSNRKVAGRAASTNQGQERVSVSRSTPANKPAGSQKTTYP